MTKLLPEEIVETEVGKMVLKGVFRIEKDRLVAGGEVVSGRVKDKNIAIIERKGEVLGEMVVSNVQREKLDVDALVEGETGGISFTTEKKVMAEIGDTVRFVTREIKEQKV
jgi:translation initiation factor IF-2